MHTIDFLREDLRLKAELTHTLLSFVIYSNLRVRLGGGFNSHRPGWLTNDTLDVWTMDVGLDNSLWLNHPPFLRVVYQAHPKPTNLHQPITSLDQEDNKSIFV